MERSQKLKQELHRLAGRFNIPESDIDEELVPLMLVLEQSATKVDQAAAKINESVKPVIYNNHYGHKPSAWAMFWGNLSTGIGHNIVAISLIFSGFLMCCFGIYAFKDYMSDQEMIQQARIDKQNADYVLKHFFKGKSGTLFLSKEKYTVLDNGIGIMLNFKIEQP